MATETKESILISNPSELDKVANYRRGYKPTIKERPVLVYKAIENGVMCDGWLLVEDKEATEKVIGKYIEKEQEQSIKRLVEMGRLSREEATKRVKSGFAELAKEGKYPNYKELYPKELGKEVKLIGVTENNGYGDVKMTAYLSDGKDITAVNADKLAFVLKYLPDSKIFFSATNPIGSPLTFITQGKRKGLLMPLYGQSIPSTIKDAAIKVKAKITRRVQEPKPLQKPKVEGKEPWQMTVDYYNEYEHPSSKRPIEEIRQDLIKEMGRRHREDPDKLPNELRQNFRPEKYFANWSDSNLRDWHSSVVASAQSHKRLVEKALKEGKPVPAKVLEEYPELTKQVAKPTKATAKFQTQSTKQSDRALAIDRSLLAKQVVSVGDPRWLKHPNRFDIRGVDTPKKRGDGHKRERVVA